MGYTNISVYEEGYPAWIEAFGSGQTLTVTAGGDEGTIDVAQFQQILSENPDLTIPGYRVEREFGKVRIWLREREEPETRKWQSYEPNVAGSWHAYLQQVDPQSPVPPANFGIRFAD